MAPKGTLAINAAKYQIKNRNRNKNSLLVYGNRFSRKKLDELLLFTLELERITKRN